MKILILNDGFPPHYVGGAEISTEQIALTLQQRGHSIQVICLHQDIYDKTRNDFYINEEIYNGLSVTKISFPVSHSLRYYNYPRLFEWAINWLERTKPDILYVGMYWYLFAIIKAASFLKIPFVLITHGYDLFCLKTNLMRSACEICSPPFTDVRCWRCSTEASMKKPSLLAETAYLFKPALTRLRTTKSSRINLLKDMSLTFHQMKAVKKWLCKYASAIVSPSRFTLTQHRHALKSFTNFYHVPHGLKCDRFAETGAICINGRFIFAYIGRIDSLKGIDTAIQAVHRLPQHLPVHLKIYGDTEHPSSRKYAEFLRNLVASDERIEFSGLVRDDKLINAYRQMTILVQPSLTEVYGMTIQEALASRRPVICSDAGGMPEMIKDGDNGLIFPSGDVQALSRAMLRVIEEPGLLEHLASHAKPYQDIGQSAIELEKIFRTAIKKVSSRRTG